jgi:hypothetical protein
MHLEREIQIVNSFIVAAKRERYVEFLKSMKGRSKFLHKLYHFSDFEPDCVVELTRASDSAEGLIAELRRRGAADQCYVVSVVKELDRVIAPLEKIIREVFASVVHEGTIVCCVPGRLAYYEGEAPHTRFILHKRRAR